jgi:amino acid transporter
VLIVAVTGVALFWAANAWVLTLSTPVSQVLEYNAEGLTAITPVARAYWGWGNVLIVVTAFTGLTAIYIPSVQGASRLIFALARHGLLPAPFARLKGEKRVPQTAVLMVVLTCVAMGLLSLALLHSGLDSFIWWSNALVFFAALTYTGVNIANLVYFRRIAPAHFNFVRNLFVPIAGICLNLYLIYAAFFSALWEAPLRTGRSVVVICLALFALLALAVTCMRFFRHDLLTGSAPISVDMIEGR